MRNLVAFAWLTIVAAAGARPAFVVAQVAASADERFLAGLRERQLFGLAEAQCRRQLAEAYLTDRRRTLLSAELARTILESALYAKSPEREERFARAVSVIDEALRATTVEPWKLPLVVQRGEIDLIWGERLREEAQSLHSADAALETARARLRQSTAALKQALVQIAAQLQEANRRREPKPDLPSALELHALERHASYQLARGYRNLGESYPSGSADRASSIEQAVEVLGPLSRSETSDAITWQSRLDEALCRRLLADLDGAEKLLDLIDSQTPPSDVADRARAERIRIRLAAGDLPEARKLIRDEDVEPAGSCGPEVRLAVLEWLLAAGVAADGAGKRAEADDFRRRATALASLIAERHSVYWAHKAETLTAEAVAASPASNDAAQLVKAAESLYAQGNIDRALEIYDQAFAKESALKRLDAAFTIGFTAAAIQQHRGRSDDAARRFAALAEQYGDHQRAGEARLLAAFNVGQTLAAAPPADAAAMLARYDALLSEQIAKQPDDKSTSQARLWLGRLRVQQRRIDEAAALFAAIAPDDPTAVEAVARLSDCRLLQLAETQALGIDVRDRALLSARQLADFAPGYPDQLPATMTAAARSAAVSAARLTLLYLDGSGASATSALSHVVKLTELPADERATATLWNVVGLIAVGRLDDAEKALVSPMPADAADVSRAAARIDQIAAKFEPGERRRAAVIVMQLIDASRTGIEQLPPELRLTRSRAEASSLVLVGRAAEARMVYEVLSARYPSDVGMQESFAAFLLSQADQDSHTAALAQWRKVEQSEAEGSARWFRARLGIAETYEKLGDRARALQIIELTAALHPALGGDEMKKRFESCAARVR